MQYMIEQLEQTVIKLYRMEIQEAMRKWNSAFEELASIIERGNGEKSNILQILEVIAEAMKNRDYILMADLIRYELVKLINEAK